jgi:hypothetical protein
MKYFQICEDKEMSMEYARLLKQAEANKKKAPPVYRFKEYKDGITKQSFKDACDVNKILKKHGIKNAASHAVNYPPEFYADFEGVDLLEAHNLIEKAHTVFAELPSEVRNEFQNDALAFAGFASDPNNRDKLAELIPAIAEPGTFFPNPVQRGGSGAGMATAPVVEETPVEVPTQTSDPVSPPVDNK